MPPKPATIRPLVLASTLVALACEDRGETTMQISASTASVGDTTEAASSANGANGSEGSNETTPPETSGSSGGSEAGMESVGGSRLMITLLTATPLEITDDDIVTFLAQVVDPDGADDIVGGLLKSESGDATYGAFVQISEGTFSITLDWDTIDAVEPITYSRNPTRAFLAEFTDTAANMATEAVEVRFDCGGFAICEGACTELGSETNCAACDDACGGQETCIDGACRSSCGDGLIEPGEQCDGLDVQGFDCVSLGLRGGKLSCDPDTCTFDTSLCSV